MKVYIQSKNGVPLDQDHFSAYIGFKEMGFETIFFNTFDELADSNIEDVVVGYIGTVKSRLRDLGKQIENVDYPECLYNFLGRRVWKSTINIVNSSPEMWPVFIKPIENKIFKGRQVHSIKDLIGCGSCYEDHEIWCSEIIELVAEFRVYVLYNSIIDVRRYGGVWVVCCDKSVIESCMNSFTSPFASYAMDFGVTKEGKTVLIEVNNTCSIGSYGLDPILYAKFISARWAEITGTTDECI